LCLRLTVSVSATLLSVTKPMFTIETNVYKAAGPCQNADGSTALFAASLTKFSTLKMEAVRSSETSVNFYQTPQRNIPEYSRVHI
jgi:hypothetical protein